MASGIVLRPLTLCFLFIHSLSQIVEVYKRHVWYTNTRCSRKKCLFFRPAYYDNIQCRVDLKIYIYLFVITSTHTILYTRHNSLKQCCDAPILPTTENVYIISPTCVDNTQHSIGCRRLTSASVRTICALVACCATLRYTFMYMHSWTRSIPSYTSYKWKNMYTCILCTAECLPPPL